MSVDSKIEVVNLERGERYDGVDRPLQPFVTAPSLTITVYSDWPFAEQECKRRCLEVLAARANVPDGVAFVRTWESVPAIVEPLKPARCTAREGRGNGVQCELIAGHPGNHSCEAYLAQTFPQYADPPMSGTPAGARAKGARARR